MTPEVIVTALIAFLVPFVVGLFGSIRNPYTPAAETSSRVTIRDPRYSLIHRSQTAKEDTKAFAWVLLGISIGGCLAIVVLITQWSLF
ncbi:MAG: hypothetical protein K0S68_297 [Candidatus Saccharibacteria bacterium]|nr:hypothetical protein [Candidatus Saccharibacteria bacterium]